MTELIPLKKYQFILENTSTPQRITNESLSLSLCANSLDLDEAAHDELPHMDLHCLPSSL